MTNSSITNLKTDVINLNKAIYTAQSKEHGYFYQIYSATDLIATLDKINDNISDLLEPKLGSTCFCESYPKAGEIINNINCDKFLDIKNFVHDHMLKEYEAFIRKQETYKFSTLDEFCSKKITLEESSVTNQKIDISNLNSDICNLNKAIDTAQLKTHASGKDLITTLGNMGDAVSDLLDSKLAISCSLCMLNPTYSKILNNINCNKFIDIRNTGRIIYDKSQTVQAEYDAFTKQPESYKFIALDRFCLNK